MEDQDRLLKRLESEGRLDTFRERYAVLLREHDGNREHAMRDASVEFAASPEQVNGDARHVRRLAHDALGRSCGPLEAALWTLRNHHTPWPEIAAAPSSLAVSMLSYARGSRGGLNDFVRSVFVRLIASVPEPNRASRLDGDGQASSATLQAVERASRAAIAYAEREQADRRAKFRERVIAEFGQDSEAVETLMQEAFGSCSTM